MCGRFTLTVDPAQLQETFPWISIPDNLTPRYNIAPTQPVAVVPNTGENKLDFFLWGLIPSWAKDPEIGNRLINARSETLAEKPSFRTAYRRRRCLVLADGFYEWQLNPDGKTKTPVFIRLKSGAPFAFAGLWEIWMHPDGSEVRSTTIITTKPNQLMQPIHNRMPVILPPDTYEKWLDPSEQGPESLNALLQPYSDTEMTAYLVSRLVNNPKNDVPECINPAS